MFAMKDCDGDGVADPTCREGGQFGVVQSSAGCRVDTWPNGKCNDGPCWGVPLTSQVAKALTVVQRGEGLLCCSIVLSVHTRKLCEAG